MINTTDAQDIATTRRELTIFLVGIEIGAFIMMGTSIILIPPEIMKVFAWNVISGFIVINLACLCFLWWVSRAKAQILWQHPRFSYFQEKQMSTNLANAVSTSREALGWSIRELATRAGISTGNVCRIESGDDTTIKMAEKIAAAFGIELISLLNLAKALEKPSTELKKLEVEMREMALRMINGLGPKEK